MRKIANFMTTLAITASVLGASGGGVVHAATSQIATSAAIPVAPVRGQIRDAPAGLTVQAIGLDGSVLAEARTNAEGYYELEGVTEGSYRVVAFDLNRKPYPVSASNHVLNVHQLAAPCTPAQAENAPIQPLAFAPAAPQVIAAPNAGAITGTVTAQGGGASLYGVAVYAYTRTNASKYDYVKSTHSDFNGNYTLSGLDAINHYLRFDGGSSTNYVTEFYNDKATLAQADAIAVTAANTATANAALTVGGIITGVVRSITNSAPLKSAIVSIYTSTTSTSPLDLNYTGADGQYKLVALPAGTYYLRVQPPFDSSFLEKYYNNKSSLATADGITVTSGVTQTADVTLEVGGSLSGRVTASDTSGPVTDGYAYLYSLNECNRRVFKDSKRLDANGVYTFTNLATGSYFMGFEPTKTSLYLAKYYNDKSSLEDATPIIVTAGVLTNNINAVLAKGTAITGRVTADDTGLGLSDVVVDAYTKTGTTFYYRNSGSTDANGYYTLTRLTTGAYYLQFANSPFADSATAPYAQEYYNNKTLLETSDAVAVTAGATTPNINVGLARGSQITGVVKAADTNLPLHNVRVTIYRPNGKVLNEEASAYTDAAGVYTSSGVLSGTYFVEFNPSRFAPIAKNYMAQYYNNKPIPRYITDTTGVAVPTSGIVPNINASLSLGGKITGHVTLSGSVPASTEFVYAYLLWPTSSDLYFVSYGYSDSNGDYEVTGLPSGQYKLYFFGTSRSVTVGCNTTTTQYAELWFNQKPDSNSATFVPVTAPNATQGINAALSGSVPKKLIYLPMVTKL